MITFEQVLVLHRIVKLGSFKAAANDLHKTQPALSVSIKKLEEHIGIELLDRSAYRPRLTAHGRLFYEKSLKLIEAMDELDSVASHFQMKIEAELTIAIDGICLNTNLLRFFRTFGESYPYTKLDMGLDILSEAERRVLDGEAHLGLSHFLFHKSDLVFQKLTKIQMLPVMNRDLFKNRQVKSQDDLLGIEQIVIGDKNEKGASFGLLPDGKKWRIMDSHFKREIILAGLGWGHLPKQYVEEEIKQKRLVVLNFQDVHPRELDIFIFRKKRDTPGPIAKKLWDELIRFHV